MEIKSIRTIDLIPYEKNPRKNDKAVSMVAKSIKEFGFKVPIVIDANNVIVAGHTRYKAVVKLGWDEVPCVVADDLNEKQIKAFRIADNKVGELAEWDESLLIDELEDLEGYFTGFDLDDFENEEDENPYTTKVQTPIYSVTKEKPSIDELVDRSKVDYLMSVIDQADVNQEEREFLRLACYRFLKFSYKDIAEYYAHSDKNVRDAFDELVLVIIDYDKAIEKGFISLNSSIIKMMEQDDG